METFDCIFAAAGALLFAAGVAVGMMVAGDAVSRCDDGDDDTGRG